MAEGAQSRADVCIAAGEGVRALFVCVSLSALIFPAFGAGGHFKRRHHWFVYYQAWIKKEHLLFPKVIEMLLDQRMTNEVPMHRAGIGRTM